MVLSDEEIKELLILEATIEGECEVLRTQIEGTQNSLVDNAIENIDRLRNVINKMFSDRR